MKVLWSYEQGDPFLQIDAETLDDAAQLVDAYSGVSGKWHCNLASVVETPLVRLSIYGELQGDTADSERK